MVVEVSEGLRLHCKSSRVEGDCTWSTCSISKNLSAVSLKKVPRISPPLSSSISQEKRRPEERLLFHSLMSPLLVMRT